ncbi:MAG: recombination regulator RecX [Clostridia bacterium]|nr:recombination regulator RecX [Clostridia bacterium]
MQITTKGGNAGKVHIYVDGEYSLTVDLKYWQSLGIAEKTEIDGEQLERLEHLIGVRRAFNKGLSLLVTREHSRAEIVRKLKEKGFEQYADEAAQQLCEHGYINEERFCEIYIRQLIEHKHFGKKRIYDELRSKGIDGQTAQAAIEEFELDPVNDILQLLGGKLSRYMNDEKGVNRCFNTLVRYGYSPSEIRRAFAALKEAEE